MRAVPASVLGTLFLIGGDLMLFAGLIFAFWVLRLASPVWPPPLQPRLPVALSAANTGVLLASSAVMSAATRARSRTLAARLGLCGLLGGLFLTVQGYEWVRLIRFGLTVSSGVYGALFYTLIGAHGLHVVAALAWLAAITIQATRGRFAAGDAGPIRACAMYWHFVVALWPLLYLSVYVL